MSDVKLKPWEKQAKESSKAYEAFVVYKDLGNGRTFTAVAEELHKSVSLIRRWKEKWNWQERAEAWDNSIAEKARAKKAKDYAKMIEVQTGIGQMLQAEAIKAIKSMDLSKASLSSLLEMINSGVKIERSARAMDKNGTTTESTSSNILAETLTKIWTNRK